MSAYNLVHLPQRDASYRWLILTCLHPAFHYQVDNLDTSSFSRKSVTTGHVPDKPSVINIKLRYLNKKVAIVVIEEDQDLFKKVFKELACQNEGYIF